MYSNYCRHSLLCTKYFVYVCGCVRVCVSVLGIINVNQYIVQCSLHKLKKRPTDLSQEFTVSLLALNRYSNIQKRPHSPLMKGFDADFQP